MILANIPIVLGQRQFVKRVNKEGFIVGDLVQLIIFGVMALVIFMKLREVLGRRTGEEKERPSLIQEPQEREEEPSNVIPLDANRQQDWTLPRKNMSNVDVEQKLRQFNKIDPSFDPNAFIQGAKSAYGMIMEAYAGGDTQTLKMLMRNDVYEAFEEAIQEREQKGQKLLHDIVGITAARVAVVELEGTIATIGMDFDVEVLIHLTDLEGNTLEGSPQTVQSSREHWEFEKDLNDSNPNWTLIETSPRS